MKKYTSILILLSGSTALPLGGLLLLMALVESGLFYFSIQEDIPLDAVFQNSMISLAAGAILLLWMAALLIPRFARGGMTLGRLQVGPRALYLTHALYNALTLVILWGFQVMLLLGFAHLYGQTADPSLFGPQTTMLAFYRVDLLHGLLPLADWVPWVRNIAYILALGFAAAYPATDRGQGLKSLLLAGALTVSAGLTIPAKMDGNLAIAGLIGGIAVTAIYAAMHPTYGGGAE